MSKPQHDVIQPAIIAVPPTWLCIRLLTEALDMLDAASDAVSYRLSDFEEYSCVGVEEEPEELLGHAQLLTDIRDLVDCIRVTVPIPKWRQLRLPGV